MTNVNGLSPKLQTIVSDGKITAEEIAGLTKEEKEALSKALGIKEFPETG